MNTRKGRLLQLTTALLMIAGLMAFGLSRNGAVNNVPVAGLPGSGNSGGGSVTQGQLGANPGQTPVAQPTAAALDFMGYMQDGIAVAPATGGSRAYDASRQLKPRLAESGLTDEPIISSQATIGPLPDLPVPVEPTSVVEPVQPTAVVPTLPANPFVEASQDRLSTFALDVDTGSYTAARNYINSGQLPPASDVRSEEFINYFRYDYPVPEGSAFGIYVDSAPSPYGATGTHYVRVGIQAQRVSDVQRKDAVLTFVIDVSGSMAEPNRLPLVKKALRLLVDELRPSDQVGIVVYGSEARVLLEHTNIANKAAILSAIDGLGDEGSTNAEAGIRLGYEQASKYFKADAINRLILCSDGVANVGETSPDGIRAAIRDYTKQGILLTTVGFGMGDYNDFLMEQLADDGDGNYAYVDTLSAAKRIFVENLTGTLQVVAKDAKVQVDFNPAVVSRYRLVGYENRDVADSDFRNDTVDAGEIGAGHTMTALYEVELTADAVGDALTVQMRYADPKTAAVTELKQPFERAAFGQDFASAKPRFQLAVAVAGFAEQLRRSDYTQPQPATETLSIAQRIAPLLQKDADVQEFAALVAKANDLQKQYLP